MWKKLFQFSLMILLSIHLVSIAAAQDQTGSIKGKITDKEGYPLPGAFVYVTSPSLLGMSTYITTDTGIIRIPSLPPGRYKIMVEMPGFKTVNMEDIIIRIGMIVTLNITLEMTAIEEEITLKLSSPALDVESTKIAEVADREMLKNIPFSRSIHDIINSVAGVIPSNTPYQQTSSVHGSTVRSNTYAFENILMNDPDQRHLLTTINFDTIEEVEVETSAHPTGAGFVDGGYVNVVTKSGGNKANGDINLYYTNDKLASALRSAEESSGQEVSPPSLDRNLWDASLSLGGPLWEDILWYFGNFRLISQYQKTPFIPWTDPLGEEHEKYEWHNTEKMGFFKLSGQYASKIKVSAMINYVNRYQPIHEPALNWNLPKKATRILDHEKHLSLNGRLTYIINQNTFVNLKAGFLQHKLPLLLNERSRAYSQYFDEGSGYFWGSAGFNERQTKQNFQAGAYLTRFQDNFLGGNHEIEIGAEYEFASGEWAVWKENNLLIHYYYGNPYFYGLEVSPVSGETVGKGRIYFSTARSLEEEGVDPKGELRRMSFFAQDSVTFGGRLTLHFGLRFDMSDTRIYAQIKGQSGNPISFNNIGTGLIEPLYPNVNPFKANPVPFWEDIMTWNAFSPRTGLSFDILGNGKTILKASFSRYTDYMMLHYISGLNPINTRHYHQFYWFDENGDGNVDEGDSYTLFPEDYRSYPLYAGSYFTSSVAPDIKSPYTDEYMIGLHRELFQDFSFRINYIHQTKRNIIENVLYDPENDMDWYTINPDTEDWWVPFQTVVPGGGDYPEKEITVYYRSNSAPKYFYRTKNVPELKRKYQAFEIAFNKRMSNNWQMQGSVVLSKATGNIGLGYEESAGFSRAADNPNQFLYSPENSRLDYDRPLVIKLMGTYKFPYNFSLSFYYTYMSGTPWARSVTIIPPSSWGQAEDAFIEPAKVYLEPPGSRRTTPYNNINLRIEKEFRLGRSGRLGAYVDIQNVLGTKNDFTFQNDGGFWFPEAESSPLGVRDLSPNYKKLILLSAPRVFRLGLRLRF